MIELGYIPNEDGMWVFSEDENKSIYYLKFDGTIIYEMPGSPVVCDKAGYALPLIYTLNKDQQHDDAQLHTWLHYKGSTTLLVNTNYEDVQIFNDDFIISKKKNGMASLHYYNGYEMSIYVDVVVADEVVRLTEFLFRTKSNDIYYVVQFYPETREDGSISINSHSEPIAMTPFNIVEIDGKWAYVTEDTQQLIKYL